MTELIDDNDFVNVSSTAGEPMPTANNEELDDDILIINDEEWYKEADEWSKSHMDLINDTRKKGPTAILEIKDIAGTHTMIIRGLTRLEYMKSETIFQPMLLISEEEFNSMTEIDKILTGLKAEQDKQDFILRTGVVYCSSCDGPFSNVEVLESIMTAGALSTVSIQITKLTGFDVSAKLKKV